MHSTISTGVADHSFSALAQHNFSGIPAAHLLKDGDLLAHVDAWQHPGASHQASHHVGDQVAIQVGRHLHAKELRQALCISRAGL